MISLEQFIVVATLFVFTFFLYKNVRSVKLRGFDEPNENELIYPKTKVTLINCDNNHGAFIFMMIDKHATYFINGKFDRYLKEAVSNDLGLIRKVKHNEIRKIYFQKYRPFIKTKDFLAIECYDGKKFLIHSERKNNEILKVLSSCAATSTNTL